jgi:serine/threonine-protein kinase ULK/ATG1
MELMGLLLRRFGSIISKHSDYRAVRMCSERYLCTGTELGSGAFSTVYLGRHVDTARPVAIKTMDWVRLTHNKPKQRETLLREIEIMRASEHPNIVHLYDTVRDDSMVHLVMEYCAGGTLEDFVKRKGPLSEDLCRHFLRQLGNLDAFKTAKIPSAPMRTNYRSRAALGLKYLRGKGVIHRDLKPANLLLSSDQETANLKIADFTYAQS